MSTATTTPDRPAPAGLAPDNRAILAALERIEKRLDEVQAIAEKAVNDSRDAVATVTDTVDQLIGKAQSQGIDLDRRLANLIRAAERLSSNEAIQTLEETFGRIEQIRVVLTSGILDPASVAIVAKAGRSLASAAAEPPAEVGMFGLLRAMSERETRVAAGFLVQFARRMGAALADTSGRIPAQTRSGSRSDSEPRLPSDTRVGGAK